MASHLAVAVLAVLAACSTAQIFKPQPAPGFICPSDGMFNDPQDCTSYYQCLDGDFTKSQCRNGLQFNAKKGWCDYPKNVDSFSCRKPVANPNNPCQGTDEVAYVEVQGYCNCYFTCGNGILFPQCSFCPAGQFFNATAGACNGLLKDSNVCGNRQMVKPEDQTFMLLEPVCRPGQEDVYAELREKIRKAAATQG